MKQRGNDTELPKMLSGSNESKILMSIDSSMRSLENLQKGVPEKLETIA